MLYLCNRNQETKDFKQLNRLRFKPAQKRANPVFRSGDV